MRRGLRPALYPPALTARTPELRRQMTARRAKKAPSGGTQDGDRRRPPERSTAGYAGAFGFGSSTRIETAQSGFSSQTGESNASGRHLTACQPPPALAAIVSAMQDDERRHAEEAAEAGGRHLPTPVRWLMRNAARVMTGTAHWI